MNKTPFGVDIVSMTCFDVTSIIDIAPSSGFVTYT